MNTAPLIAQAFAEDLPQGDLTTDLFRRALPPARICLRAGEDLVLAGRQVFEDCLRFSEPRLEANWQFRDGELVLRDQAIAWFKGSPLGFLRAERVALNFLGHLSGVATLTRCYVQAILARTVRLEATRASTPGLRALERAAVAAGGGHNARANLSEACVITRGHVALAGSVEAAIAEVRALYSGPLEVECVSATQAHTAREFGAARLTLREVDAETLRAVRDDTPAHVEVGVGGAFTLDEVRGLAAVGINFIRVTTLIQSAPAALAHLDLNVGEK